MKNINSLISDLARTSLLKRTARNAHRGSVKRSVTDTLLATAIGKNSTNSQHSLQQKGSLAAVGSMAWQAYQRYSQQAYGGSSTMQKANLQRAYMQGVYSQRNNAQSQDSATPTQPHEPDTLKPQQSRYIPSPQSSNNTQQPLTYSPATLTQQQFAEVLEDQAHANEQMLLLRAMITAAYADGHLDEQERQNLFQQVDKFALSSQDKANLFDELRNPWSVSQLVDAIPNSQTAIEVYAVSLLSIDEQQPAAQVYLRELATELKLPSDLVKKMHTQSQNDD